MKVYRYTESRHASSFFDDYAVNYSMEINLTEYDVIKETKCGVWISHNNHDKFVNMKTKKKFACKTKREAMESFIRRKRAQIRILETSLTDTKIVLSIAEYRYENDKI